MRLHLSFLALAVLMLACSSADVVQTVTPIPSPSAMPTGTTSLTPFLSTPADFGTLGLGADQGGETPPLQQRTVCTDVLNVRSGPSLESAAVAWLRRGDIVRVLESRDGWERLANPAGWVRGVYLCQ